MANDLALDDISRRRWDRIADPAEHKPETALAAAAEHIAEHGADHVLIIIAKELPDGCGHRYMSAGNLDHFGQVGLLSATQALMLGE